jgi:hypothetical protein
VQFTDSFFRPQVDNTYSNGTAANRWSVIYAGTGTINTSDARSKQQITTDLAPELKAWAKVNFCKYRFNDAFKLRKFYYANGIIGVHDYLTQLPGYEATMRGQYPSLWKDGTYIGVKEGTQLPVDPEWLQKMQAIDKIQSNIQQQ